MSELPQRLGKYQILETLGQGAMGVVYKGLDPDIERIVAVKVMHPHLSGSAAGDALHQRFRREARTAARCLHPNIVTVFDLGRDAGRDFIVMEFVEGEELKEVIARGHAFSQEEAVYVLMEVLKALEVAHRQEVVHRDIKPGNIILLVGGGVKVADFGVARTDESDLTMTGHLIGTPVYMCPEGLQGEPVDHRADLYSAGMVLLELLTGERVLPQQMYRQPLQALLDQIFAQPRGSRLPEALQWVLRTALAEDPRARFADAASFMRALEGVSQGPADERTVMRDLAASVTAARPVGQSGTPGRYASSSPDQFVWTPELLKKLEAELVTHTGPVAGLLIRKLSATSNAPMELVEALAGHITDPGERAAFVRKARHCMGSGSSHDDTVPGGSESPAARRDLPVAETLPAEQLERLATHLAAHVGPFARQLVTHHARRSYKLVDFYRQLSARIPDADERQRFLAEIGG
jgi:serine/threonine protein kinase